MFLGALGLTCSSAPIAKTATESRGSPPTCIGGFCFGPQVSPQRAELVSRHGAGHRISGKFPAHCYQIATKTYVYFRIHHGQQQAEIASILLSDVPACADALPPISPFPRMQTSEGLGLGDPYEKVIALYGTPSWQGDAGLSVAGPVVGRADPTEAFGEVALTYIGSGLWTALRADIYVRSGKVSAIEVSFSE